MSRWEPKFRWRAVMEDLRQQIVDGDYPPKSQIPSIRTIMQRYEVGRNTAIHAVASLEEQGYVLRVQSHGTLVRPKEDWPDESQEGSSPKTY